MDQQSDIKHGHIVRKDDRHRVLKAGTAAINHKNSTISCTVRDLSNSGARLKFKGIFRPPHEFILIIPSDDWESECQVAWRNESELGVEFMTAPRPLHHSH